MDLVNILYKVGTTDLDKAEQKLGKLGATSKNAEAQADKLGKGLSEVGKLGGPIGEVANYVDELQGKLSAAVRAGALLGPALFAVAGAAGILAAVRFAGPLDDLGDLAEKLGMSTTQVALLDQQMKASGTSIDTYFGAVQRVANALSKADDDGKKANAALSTLGVSAKSTADPMTLLTTLTETYGTKLKDGTVSTDEMAALQLVLGRNYREVIVAADAAGVAQDRLNSFTQAGIGISSDGSKAASDFESAQNDLGFVLQVVGSQLVGKVIPAFSGLINAFVDSYKNGGLVKVAFDTIGVAANVVMVPIRALMNLFIALDAAVTSVGKSIGAVFAALATGSMEPLRALKADVAKIFEDADKRVKSIGLWGTDSGAVDAPKTFTPTRGTGLGAGTNTAKKQPSSDPLAEADQRIADNLARWQERDIAKEEQATAALFKQVEAWKAIADPAAKYRTELRELIKAYEDGRVSSEVFASVSGQLEDSIAKVGDASQETSDKFNFMERIGQTAFKGLEDALTTLSSTGKLSFRSLTSAILSDIARLVVQMAVIKPLLGGVQSLMGGGSFMTGFTGAFMQSAKGNVFDKGPVMHGFRGGIGELGEKGAEAVMPLKRTSSGALGVIAAGGPSSSGVAQYFTINVTVEGGDDAEETGGIVAQAIQERMMRGFARDEIAKSGRTAAYKV